MAGTANAVIADCEPGSGYSAQGVCSLTVDATPVCTGSGTPQLEYVATAQGTTASAMTLTWVNPTGPDVVQTGLPLTGSVAWPSGSWADGSVEVVFDVNPTAVVTVAHPSGAACVTGVSQVLSATGSDTMPLVAGSAALVGLGLAVVLVARRRRSDAPV